MRPGAPEAAETAGSQSVLYVVTPWDILEAYYWRALRCVRAVPLQLRMDWLEHLRAVKRAVWVSRFREGSESLGKVILEVFIQRDVHWQWIPPADAAATKPGSQGVWYRGVWYRVNHRGRVWGIPHHGANKCQQT